MRKDLVKIVLSLFGLLGCQDALESVDDDAGPHSQDVQKVASVSGRFRITGPASVLNSSLPLVQWTLKHGAAMYRATLARDRACTDIVALQPELVQLQWQVSQPLADGRYWICVEAQTGAGQWISAENSPLEIDIDTSQPLEFAIEEVYFIDHNSGIVQWQDSAGATGYRITLQRQPECPLLSSYMTLVTERTFDFMELASGEHFVCVFSFDRAGNSRAASNNGQFSFKIE